MKRVARPWDLLPRLFRRSGHPSSGLVIGGARRGPLRQHKQSQEFGSNNVEAVAWMRMRFFIAGAELGAVLLILGSDGRDVRGRDCGGCCYGTHLQ